MDRKAEQYYPTYQFEHRDVVLAEFEAALTIANDQTRHYGLLANILLGVLALLTPLFIQGAMNGSKILSFVKANENFLFVVVFFFSLIVLRYFTELQKQIVFNTRKVITLRLLLGLDYGAIHLTLPNWRIEGATNPFAVPLFPRWLSFGSVPFWTILAGNLFIGWSVLAQYTWRYWGLAFVVLALTWFYRWSLNDRHQTIWLALVKGLAVLFRMRLVGNLEYTIYRAKLSVVELERLKVGQKALRKILVAIEDRRFNDHGGVDWQALARASLSQFRFMRRKKGYIKSGGSTITMQLVRTLFIVSGQPTWKRKLFEILLAPWLSRQFTKPELLDMYIASVRYERGVMGLASAMNHFFGELKGKTLSNEQAFFLVERLSNVTSTVNMERVNHLMTRAGVELNEQRLIALYEKLASQAKRHH